jgi:hypothetical protein
MQNEPDFPPGHPARFDYDPESQAAKDWARVNIHPKGERDWPPGHVKAVDTEGNQNDVPVLAGIDPAHPEREAFTGRSPEQAAALRKLYEQNASTAKETVPPLPVIALNPPINANIDRARRIADSDRIVIFCPGCKQSHYFDGRWQFNGNLQLPSFSPSLNWNFEDPQHACHSWVTNGKIQFLQDSFHSLKGQTVDLPPVAASQETINA